jgi:hypothetical protein
VTRNRLQDLRNRLHYRGQGAMGVPCENKEK